jgi:hypothetical protein
MICGIAILAGPVNVGSLAQPYQQGRAAGGYMLRQQQGLRPASRNGFPRGAGQRKYEQATRCYFGCFQMIQLRTWWSESQTKSGDSLGILPFGNTPKE